MNSKTEKTEQAFHQLHPVVETIYLDSDIPAQSLLHALAMHAVLIIQKAVTTKQAARDTSTEFFERCMAEIKLDPEGYLTEDAAPYFPLKMRKPTDDDPKPN